MSTSRDGISRIEIIYIVGEAFRFEVSIPPSTHARVLIVRTRACSNKVLIDGVERDGIVEGAFLVFDHVGPGTHSFARR